MRTLRQIRTARGLSQCELGKLLGKQQPQIARLETGREIMSFPFYRDLENKLGTAVDWKTGRLTRDQEMALLEIIWALTERFPLESVLNHFGRALSSMPDSLDFLERTTQDALAQKEHIDEY